MKNLDKLKELEQNKDWISLIYILQNTINENPSDVDAYIYIIYILHHVLVEEEYSEDEHDNFSKLLNYYFNVSYEKFYYNSDYLFFIGKIIYIAEWYFGINDDLKPITERKAFEMQKLAFEMNKNNILYEWAYRFSLGETLIVKKLAAQILNHDKQIIKFLESKGFPGTYILNSINESL